MSSRSRYDTTALVLKLQRERRRGLILGFAGAGILVALVVVYVFNMRGNNIPQVPYDARPRPTPAVAPVVTGFASTPPPGLAAADGNATTQLQGVGGATESVGATVPQPRATGSETPPPPSTPGFLRATFPKNATMFLDDVQLGRSSGQSMLEPGPHVLRARIGKRTVTQKIDVKPGENIAVRIDKRSKITIERR